MMKRKIFLSLTAAVLAMAFLFGCSSDSEGASSSASADASSKAASSAASSAVEASAGENGTRDLDGIFESLKSANPISNPFELDAMNIEYDFMLKAEDVVQYKGVKSNDNGDAGLVLVIEPAEGKAEDICEALETYKQDQVAFYGNYAEFAQAQTNVQNAVISGRDDVVIMVIASNECTADLGDAVNAALAG